MNRSSNWCEKTMRAASRSWMFDVDCQIPVKTLHDVRDDLRLKRALKRAVERDLAPQSLID
ncbi:MAG: hypothetical protein WBB81_12560, partial [Pyrinomonadaceae bacterium]